MQRRHRERLEAGSTPWVTARGMLDERVAAVTEAVDRLIAVAR
jgi:hypothetical protein